MNAIIEQINSTGAGFFDFALPMLIQSSLLIVLLLAADFLLRKKVRAVFRYWLWMLILIKLILPVALSSPASLGNFFGDKLPTVTISEPAASAKEADLPQTFAPAPIEAASRPPLITLLPPESTETAPPKVTTQPPQPVTPARPAVQITWQGVVFLAWLVVVLTLALLLLQRAVFVKSLVAQAKKPNGLMNDALEYCRKQIGLAGRVGLKISANATSPAVCGLWRPVILLPQDLAPTLGASQLRMVLLHELAHIKRGDLWINLVQTVLQIAYFYNPLLWLANWLIRRIREQAVDEAVQAALGEKAAAYPQTLVNVAKLAFKRPALSLRLIGVVESKSALSSRVKRMLSRPIPKTAKLGFVGLAAIIITAAILLPMAKAKPKPPAAKAKQQKNQQFIATLSNGVTVELVGVCNYPSTGKQWWRPDGTELGKEIFVRKGDTVSARGKAFAFVAKADGPEDMTFLWGQVEGAKGTASLDIVSGHNQPIEGMEALKAHINEKQTVTSMQIGIATGQWETKAVHNGRYPMSTGFEGRGIAFSEAYKSKKGVKITVSDDLKQFNHRIIAVDIDGDTHIGSIASVGAGNMRQTTAHFSELKLKDIAEFAFQTRPYEYVTFKNVSLKPNFKTDVQIEGGQDKQDEGRELKNKWERREEQIRRWGENFGEKYGKEMEDWGEEFGEQWEEWAEQMEEWGRQIQEWQKKRRFSVPVMPQMPIMPQTPMIPGMPQPPIIDMNMGIELEDIRQNNVKIEKFSVPLESGSMLKMETRNGAITVNGTDAVNCKIKATIVAKARSEHRTEQLAKETEIKLESSEKKLTVKIEKPNLASGESVTVNFDIAVPIQTSVDLVSRNGAITVEKISGNIKVATRNGHVTCGQIDGDLTVRTRNGHVTCDQIDGNLTVATRNGRVTCDQIDGDLTVTARNGRSRIAYSQKATPVCKVSIISRNGKIDFTPPPDFSASVEVRTRKGSIHSDLPIMATDKTGNSLKGTIGSGEGKLYLQTRNGDITIRDGKIKKASDITTITSIVSTPKPTAQTEVDITPADFDIRLDEKRGLCNLVVSIQNQSNVNIPKLKLRFYRSDPANNLNETGSAHSGWHEAGPIEPGKSWNECTRDFHLPDGQYEFHVILDYDENVPEVNENNNQAVLKVKMSNGQIVEKLAVTTDTVARQQPTFLVDFEITKQAFLQGDSIEIIEILSSTDKIETGRTYTIKGKYKLSSRDQAMLHIYATNGQTHSGQGPIVKRGTGEFTRTFTFQKDGWLHLSFYPADGGSSFGNLYFAEKGSNQQVPDISRITSVVGGTRPPKQKPKTAKILRIEVDEESELGPKDISLRIPLANLKAGNIILPQLAKMQMKARGITIEQIIKMLEDGTEPIELLQVKEMSGETKSFVRISLE